MQRSPAEPADLTAAPVDAQTTSRAVITAEKKNRFSWKRTATLILLGRAALDAKPYEKPHKSVELAYESMLQFITRSLPAGSVLPTAASVGSKYRQILRSFRKSNAAQSHGTGNSEEFTEFEQVWGQVSSAEREWEEEEKKHGQSSAEKKKQIRTENAKVGKQMSLTIMQTQTERKSPASSAAAAASVEEEEEEAEKEAELSSQLLASGQGSATAMSPTGLSFTRKRGRSSSISSYGNTRVDQLEALMQAESESRQAQLTELQRIHNAELALREHEARANEELAKKNVLNNVISSLRSNACELLMKPVHSNCSNSK